MDAFLASAGSTRKRAAVNISRARTEPAWPISPIPSSCCTVPELFHAVRELPIEFSRPCIGRSRLQLPVVDADDGSDLGEIAARENLVGILEVLVAQRRLDHGDTVAAQQLDHPLPGDPVKEGAVRRWGIDDAVLGHEYVRIAEFRDIAEHVEHQAIVEAARG